MRDDEDFAEGFDEFIEDGRVALGRKAEREQKRKHEAEIRQLIQEAEGSSDESDDSEAERRASYEAAQTRAGMDGLQKDSHKHSRERRQRTPPKITPLPSLKSCLERLQVSLKVVQSSRERKIRKKRSRISESGKQKYSNFLKRLERNTKSYMLRQAFQLRSQRLLAMRTRACRE